MEVNEGETYHIAFLPGEKYKAHILGVFDDCMIAYKYYGKHKQRWHYAIEYWMTFEGRIKLCEDTNA